MEAPTSSSNIERVIVLFFDLKHMFITVCCNYFNGRIQLIKNNRQKKDGFFHIIFSNKVDCIAMLEKNFTTYKDFKYSDANKLFCPFVPLLVGQLAPLIDSNVHH
jgi:hypothetical protein